MSSILFPVGLRLSSENLKLGPKKVVGVYQGVGSEHDQEMDLEGNEVVHFLEMVRLRLHYYRHGLPVGPYWTDFKAHVVDDITELLVIADDAIEKAAKAEQTREDMERAEEIRDEKVEEAENYRNRVCLEAEELKQRVNTLESEATTVTDLEAKVLDVRGALAFAKRELAKCEEVQAELKSTHASELRRQQEERDRKLKVWKTRFEALPKTWQERLMVDDDAF